MWTIPPTTNQHRGGMWRVTKPPSPIRAASTATLATGVFPTPTTRACLSTDHGTVAFYATLKSGGSGIFTGPDAVANKVIATGDTLLGSTVSSLSFGTRQLNNAGALAFTVALADGRQVIVRAAPNPAPSFPAISIAESNIVFTFMTTQSVLYVVQSTIDLASSAWSTIASNIVGTGGPVTYIDFGGATVPARFYRAGTAGVVAFDNAADAAYTNGWNNGGNGGIGFGPWVLTGTGVLGSSSNGYFFATSTNNAFGTSPGIDVAGKSWGIYATATTSRRRTAHSPRRCRSAAHSAWTWTTD